MKLHSLDQWHQTKKGLLTFGLVELALVYGFGSWTIDSGSLWLYLITFVFFIGAVQNLIKLVRKLLHGQRSKTS